MNIFKKKYIYIICTFFLFYSSQIYANTFHQNNFYQAKLWAIKIHKNAPGSFYCGCTINWNEKKGIPNLNSCHYNIRKNKNRAQRIEWDHVVPAWEFGHNKICWKKGGRKYCEHDDQLFKKIESDLHNIQPVIGEINGDRSNFSFNELQFENYQYGNCTVKIDFKKKQIEPTNETKGIIARTYFYMINQYHITISESQMQLFTKWDKENPVSCWECEREALIYQVQHIHNDYVKKNCEKKNFHYVSNETEK
ncbi:deoxyribonuclease I [Buchnera aphidicola (Thelaxes californica)]|uniref:Deoxyribonuclease I n=1 Tax=Buchnera aphidicola (Thelaxes californica) TaxID=1315998 RepID=A0A4D6YCN7_9GAMM|nr:endonuclease [Buchnera aphidicola]QCI26842.1 deoxyribonuclease I [Buchnera aphidicola (Thelaxes californica)]